MTDRSIALITICKGRLHHLRESLPLMLAQHPDQMVVVDYGCPDGTAAWVKANFPDVEVISVTDDPGFNASRARNAGWRATRTRWAICLDADILPRTGWLDWLRPRLDDELTLFRAARVAGKRSADSWGMACISRRAFELVDGYDEAFCNWGAEDNDFFDRLHTAGINENHYPGDFLGRIPHDDSTRTKFYQLKDIAISGRAGLYYSVIKQHLERTLTQRLPLEYRQKMMSQLLDHTALGTSQKQLPPLRFPAGTIRFHHPNDQAESDYTFMDFELSATIRGANKTPDAKQSAINVITEKENLVSCLMVTRGNPQMVAQAMHSFLKQTHPAKELVIVADADDNVALRQLVALARTDAIRLIEVSQPGLRLGDLRNIAVDEARGDYVCQWDDDDVYHPERLALQLKILLSHQVAATLLSRWTIWWPRERRLAVSNQRLWEGTLLCRKSAMPRYPSLSRGEDTDLVDALKRSAKIISIDAPFLYLYVVHGNNTFDAGHFDTMYRHASERFAGADYEAKLNSLARELAIDLYPAPSGA